MSDWRILTVITLIGALILAWRGLQSHRMSSDFVMRSIMIWAVIILIITVLVVYRFEIMDFLAPIRGMMP